MARSEPSFSATEGLAHVGNRVDYHVFAVIGRYLLLFVHATTGSGMGSEEGDVAGQRIRFIAW